MSTLQDEGRQLVHLLEALNPGACVLPIMTGRVDPGEMLMTGEMSEIPA